jgi:medium-chain acyl-[acyl-carrier-protein] hydrolase
MITNTRISDVWFKSTPNPQAQLRLFCFPYAGGGASIFRTWSQELPNSIEVLAVQLPGRENRWREAPFVRLSSLVQRLAQALEPYLDKPFAFFGHSMGALLSYELAQQFRLAGFSPVHLFVSARCAPHVQNPYPSLHSLPAAAFIRELSRRYNSIPDAVQQNAELMEMFLPMLRADFTMIETHIPRPAAPLDCPITVLGGLQDDIVSQIDLTAWRDYTKGTFTLRMLEGNHFFINHVRSLLLQTITQGLYGF